MLQTNFVHEKILTFIISANLKNTHIPSTYDSKAVAVAINNVIFPYKVFLSFSIQSLFSSNDWIILDSCDIVQPQPCQVLTCPSLTTAHVVTQAAQAGQHTMTTFLLGKLSSSLSSLGSVLKTRSLKVLLTLLVIHYF